MSYLKQYFSYSPSNIPGSGKDSGDTSPQGRSSPNTNFNPLRKSQPSLSKSKEISTFKALT